MVAVLGILPWAGESRADLPDAGDGQAEVAENLAVYEEEVRALSAKVDVIVASGAGGADVEEDLAGLIELWDEAGAHEAFETKVKRMYPPIWQGIQALRNAIGAGKGDGAVREAGLDLKVRLWEALGALRFTESLPEGVLSDASARGADSREQPIAAILEAIDAAVETYESGDSAGAREMIFDAYMNIFEGLEGDLIERDADLVRELELDFNAVLPNHFDTGAPVGDVRKALESMRGRLKKARVLLEKARSERPAVF